MKKEIKQEVSPLIRRLYQLEETDDREALAALRRGAGKDPGKATTTFPYVVPFLPSGKESLIYAWPYFCVASLFALNPRSTKRGAGFGAVFRQLKESESRDARFRSLLNAHEDDVPNVLRHAVRQCAASEIPVDWEQLLRDLRGWNHPDKYVQRNWAQQYWAPSSADTDTDTDWDSQE